MSYYNGKKVLTVVTTASKPAGTYEIKVNGNYDVSNYTEVAVNVPASTIAGVNIVDSELIIDNETVDAHQININGSKTPIYIEGDDNTITVAGGDNTIDLSECISSIEILDNNPSGHGYIVTNLSAENIAKGVTILGVTGTHESGTPIEVASAEEMDALLVAANVNKIYKYVGTTDATYEYGELYQVVEE